jgi:hypothetical protein
MADIENLYYNQVIPMINNELCATILTQVSDVEDETNGLLTYDRKIVKVEEQKMQEIADAIFKAYKEKCNN